MAAGSASVSIEVGMGDATWTIFSSVRWLGEGLVRRVAARFRRRFACRWDVGTSVSTLSAMRGLLDGGNSAGDSRAPTSRWRLLQGDPRSSSLSLSVEPSFSNAVESFRTLAKSKVGSA